MPLAQVNRSVPVISRSEATRDLGLKSKISPHFVRRNDTFAVGAIHELPLLGVLACNLR